MVNQIVDFSARQLIGDCTAKSGQRGSTSEENHKRQSYQLKSSKLGNLVVNVELGTVKSGQGAFVSR